jgi:hypothetical protein
MGWPRLKVRCHRHAVGLYSLVCAHRAREQFVLQELEETCGFLVAFEYLDQNSEKYISLDQKFPVILPDDHHHISEPVVCVRDGPVVFKHIDEQV